MKIESFRHKMVDFNLVEIGNFIIFKRKRNKWAVYNVDTEETQVYDGLNHKPIIDLVAKLETMPPIIWNGGRGAGGGSEGTHTWRGASGGGGEPNDIADFPARMNNKIKVKSFNDAVGSFRREHGASDREHAIAVDRNGFVYSYSHGNSVSVATPAAIRNKRAIIIHNHPNNSTFSPSDLLNVATTKQHGVVATHSKGYRTFTKGTHFKAEDFVKAVKKAEKTGLKGKDINDAVDRFLKRNQKKYGYHFANVLD